MLAQLEHLNAFIMQKLHMQLAVQNQIFCCHKHKASVMFPVTVSQD